MAEANQQGELDKAGYEYTESTGNRCVTGRGNGYERKMDGDDLRLQSLTPMRNQYTGQSCRITLTILC